MSKLKKILSVLLSLILAISTIITVLPNAYAETNTNYDVLEDTIEIDEPTEEYYKDLKELIPGEDYVEGEIIIKYSPENSEQSLNDIANEFDLDVECKLDNNSNTFDTLSVDDSINEDGLFVLSFTEDKEIADLVQEVTSVEEIEYAQPNYLYDLCSDDNYKINNETINGYDSQRAMFNSINFGSVTYTGKDVVVAVIDTGIDLAHPALEGCFWNDDGIVGLDSYRNVPITEDDDFIYTDDHGTHVAGIIAMQQSSTYPCKGIAPGVKIMNLQATNDENKFPTDSLVTALDFAQANGADIVNMSVGKTLYDYALNQACNAAARSMVIIASAGNDGVNAIPNYPGAYSSVIGVMAYGGSTSSNGFPDEIKATITDNNSLLNANYPVNGQMVLANFSTHDTKGKYYDIVAPGVNICSTKSREETDSNFEYMFLSGTSMASPVVAGVAALYLEKNPDATPGQVRDALRKNSGKNVETYNSFIGQENVESDRFIENQLDVSFILSIAPDANIDNVYELDSTESDLSFSALVKEQFDGAIADNEHLTYEDLRLVSELSFESFEPIENCFHKLSELPNLFSISFTGETFNDENLGEIFKSGDFESLVEIEITRSQIMKLNFLNSVAPSLSSLKLYLNDKLCEIVASSNFSGLNDVVIMYSQKLKDISFVSNSYSLNAITVNNCSISDISVLANLTNLKLVSVSNNYITDISPLQNLSKLVRIDADNNLITNIGKILELKKLGVLYLHGNFLSNNTTISNVFSQKTLADSKIKIFTYTPDKDFVPIEKIISYDTSFKRTESFKTPNLFAFPYDASHKNNINLSSSNSYIKIHSNSLSYNKNFNYNTNLTEYKSVINYECDGITGSFNAYLLMPTIESVSIEKYNFDDSTDANYIAISTTIDTTKVKVNGFKNDVATEIEYDLQSDSVCYEDYDDERIIKIDISDTFNANSSIRVSAGDDIGYFATKYITDRIDITVNSSIITNVEGYVEKLFLLENNIVGIGSNAINSNCSAALLVLPESISSISSNAFNDCNIQEVYIKNSCATSLTNIFNNCSDMTVYVSYVSPIKTFSGPQIVSDYHFENNKLIKYYGDASNVVLPKYLNIDTIVGFAFSNVNTIETIELTKDVTKLEPYSFAECPNLSNINSVLELDNIGKNSFADTKIQQIAIILHNNESNNTTSVDTEGLFKNCKDLENVYFDIRKTTIHLKRDMFYDCQKLKHVNFSSANNIYVYANTFENCKTIEKLPFEKIYIVGKQAFKNCSALTGNIVFRSGRLYNETFYNCSKIDSITFTHPVTLESNGLVGTTSLKEIGFISASNNYCTTDSFAGCENINVYVNDETLIESISNSQHTNSKLNICTDFVLNDQGSKLIEYVGEKTTVAIPTCLNVSAISDFAFCYNEDLTSVTIPDSVIEIGKGAFEGCEKLNDIIGGKNVITIGDDAFSDCINLKDISMFSSVVYIGGSTFANSGVEKVTLPNTVLECKIAAFEDCNNLTEFEFSGFFNKIPIACFRGCPQLERCIINYTCKSIESNAFLRCGNLKQVYIPCSVTNISTDAFPTEISLFCEKDAPAVSADISNTIYPNYEIVNGILLNYQSDLGYDYLGANNKRVIEVPNAAREIDDYIFCNNKKIDNVILSDYTKVIGDRSFMDCSVSDITMPSEMTSIGDSAFNRTKIKTMHIPTGITKIGDFFMHGTPVQNVYIPDTVTEIGEKAFGNCSKLRNLFISDNVTTIDPAAFEGSTHPITLFGENNTYLNQYVSAQSEQNNNNILICRLGYHITDGVLTSYSGNDVNIQIPFGIGIESIADEVFKNNLTVETISIASGVTSIGAECFSGCTSLTAMVVPDDVVSVEEDAFNNIQNLTIYCKDNSYIEEYCLENGIITNTDYDISDGVLYDYNGTESNVIIPSDLCITEVGDEAFVYNSTIINVIVPEGVGLLGRTSFGYCSALKTITLPTSNSVIVSPYTFAACNKMTNVHNSTSISQIDPYAFYCCVKLEAMDLSNVKKISYNAFDNCTGLPEVTLGTLVTSIGDKAFRNCGSLFIKCYDNTYAYRYAVNNNIPYVLLDTMIMTTTPLDLFTTTHTSEVNSSISVDESSYTAEEALYNYIQQEYNGEMTVDDIDDITTYMVDNGWW